MNFILHGDILYADTPTTLRAVPDGYLVCENGRSGGVFETVPETYNHLPIQEYRGKLIFPGLVDLHIHAPQFAFRGTGMDLELIPWLNRQAFPEEARYGELDYAKKAYGLFADRMRRSATTRAVIFGTRHREATELLMDDMEQTGLVSYVGKVNMDRNAPPDLQEESPEVSAAQTVQWLEETKGRYRRTYPILTPRFIPSCSDALMEQLGELQKRYHLPVQSHLSENPDEIAWVKRLCPESRFYGDAYARWGLFGGETKTVMAHCVHSVPEEVALMAKNGVFVAHCPASNLNLASGIAPIRRYLRQNIRVGLGSDVAGGQTESIFRAVTDAIQVSKLYWRLVDRTAAPLTFPEAFYLATAGGGAFFGKVGSFAAGFELDAVVLDDSTAPTPNPMPLSARLERAACLGLDQTGILEKYVQGKRRLSCVL